MKQQITSLILALSATGMTLADNPSLRIYSGTPDTIRTDKATIVAVTTPGATAQINDQDVHVYRTGSFGAHVNLSPGDNLVNIVSAVNGDTSRIERHIYYDNTPKNTHRTKSHQANSQTRLFSDPIYVTSRPGAYLQYGNGDDRLGGSKMGFITDGIAMKVIGEKGSLYCVRLASNRIAYIPKTYTEPAYDTPTIVNTGSWSVSNTGRTDRVVVALPQRLPYQYSTSIDPSVITVDLFGATDNSNWITQRSANLGIIDFVDFEQVADDVYRVILRLKDKNLWGYSVSYEGNNLVIDVRHRPKSLRLRDLTIGLDAGHGGNNPGAISPSGIKEKDVNLDIVLRIRDLLERKGTKVVLTRDSDTAPSMADRKKNMVGWKCRLSHFGS